MNNSKRRRVENFISRLNEFDANMIAVLMNADPRRWLEITTPLIGSRVTYYGEYRNKEPRSGRVSQIASAPANDGLGGLYYVVEFDDGGTLVTSDVNLDVGFDTDFPHCDKLYQFKDGVPDYRLLSNLGFRVFEHQEFGIFFGFDDDDDEMTMEDYWEPLYDAFTDDVENESDDEDVSEFGYADDEDDILFDDGEDRQYECAYCGDEHIIYGARDPHGILFCDRCGRAFCRDCLHKRIRDDVIRHIIFVNDGIWCPDCIKQEGYTK